MSDDSKKPFFASSNDNTWKTPTALAQLLAKAVGGQFDLDAASNGVGKSPIKAAKYFTPDNDGLAQPWTGVTWVNPPYGRSIGKWIAFARGQVEAGNARMVVALPPANTDTAWWHDHIEGIADYRRFLRGRLRFNDGPGCATFGSVIVVWGGTPDDHSRIDEALTEWEASRRKR